MMPYYTPCDWDAERSLLGSLLLDNARIAPAAARLAPSDFFDRAHGAIFEAILALAGAGSAVDLVTLRGRLEAQGHLERIGGIEALADLVAATPAAANAEHYAEIVAEKAERRRDMVLADEVHRLAADPTAGAEERTAARARLANAPTPSGAGKPVLVRAADVAARPLAWLWPGRVPAAKLTLVAGDPGLGKSLLALDIAARVTRGRPWPDAPASAEQPVGNVVLLSAEDDLADTIRPRLEAAGADLARVVLLQAIRRAGAGRPAEKPFSLVGDLSLLERAIAETGDVRLVILDPLSAYLGPTDSYRNAAVRALLALLRDLAERQGVAVLAVTHLNKNAAASALYRPTGSLAFVAAARAVWAVARDRERPDRHLLLPLKCNLAGRVGGLGYAIVESPERPGAPVLAWEAEPVLFSAQEALRASTRDPEEQSELERAAAWLRELLAPGPLPVAEIKRQAREAGLCWPTVKRAKRLAPVETHRSGFAGPWHWQLAPHRGSTAPIGDQNKNVIPYGERDPLWGPDHPDRSEATATEEHSPTRGHDAP